MFGQFIKRHNAIGCLVGEREIRLAQLLRSPAGGIQITARSAALPEGEASKERSKLVSDTIRQLLRSGGFEGRTVVGAVPGGQLWCRKLRLAPMPDIEVPSAAHFLAANELGVGVESFTSETLKLATVRDGSSKIEVLTIGCETRLLDEHARSLAQGGLEPVALDGIPWAIARTLTGSPSRQPQEPLLILDINFKATDMIVAVSGAVSFLHRVDGGILRIAELLAHRLDVPLADAKRLYESRGVVQAPADGASTQSLTEQQAVDGAADAAAMFGRELAREVSLSLFHFREALNGTVPEVGVLVSGPAAGSLVEAGTSQQILQAVTQLTGIRFVSCVDLLDSAWNDALSRCSGGIEPWLVPVGLALYDAAAATADATAEAA